MRGALTHVGADLGGSMAPWTSISPCQTYGRQELDPYRVPARASPPGFFFGPVAGLICPSPKTKIPKLAAQSCSCPPVTPRELRSRPMVHT